MTIIYNSGSTYQDFNIQYFSSITGYLQEYHQNSTYPYSTVTKRNITLSNNNVYKVFTENITVSYPITAIGKIVNNINVPVMYIIPASQSNSIRGVNILYVSLYSIGPNWSLRFMPHDPTLSYTYNIPDDYPATPGPEQLNFTVPPTTEIYNINLMSSFGGVNIEPSATENTYGTWPMSYGSNITLTASGKLAHLLLTPKVATKPNVSQSVDVTVDGTTTTYPLTQNPNIDLWAGKDVKVEVSSPAPTVTVDYTNTSTPVITDTPTGG